MKRFNELATERIMKKGTYMQPVTEAVTLQPKLQLMLLGSGGAPEPGTPVTPP